MAELASLGSKLKRLREAAGLSQQALAVRAGLSLGLVARIEQEAKADILLGTAAALARALGVRVDDLADDVAPPMQAKSSRKKRAK